jgi:hypothetical protein
MLPLLYVLLATARSSLKAQRELALENLALRQQLAVVQRKTKRPRLTQADRAFWVALCNLWPDWQNALIIVKPQTVIGWHRKGFKLYWTSESRHRGGRPPIDAELRTLIRRIATENPTWGAPRVQGRSSPFQWSAGCIIATHDALPDPKSRSHTKSGVSCAHCARPRRMPRSIRACRTVGNVRRGPSSVLWVTFAIIAANLSRHGFEERHQARIVGNGMPGWT